MERTVCKMRNQHKKRSRAVSIITAGMMILSVGAALTGCGGGKEGDTKNAVVNQQEAMKGLAFKVTEVPVDDISSIVSKNGKFYGIKGTSETQGEGDETVYLYHTDVVRFDETGTVDLTIPVFRQTKENEYGGVQSGLMIDDEGNISFMSYQNSYDSETGESDEKGYLCKYDASGNEISKVDATTFVTQKEQQEEEMWLQNVLMDKEGNLYLNLYKCVRVISKDGNKLFDTEKLNTDNSWMNGMFLTNAGVPAVAIYEYSNDTSKSIIKEIDINAKGFGKEYDVTASNFGSNPLSGSGDYLCYTTGDTGIKGLRADTLASEEVINLLNIGVDNSQINEFSVNEDGSFITTGYTYSGHSGTYTMNIISPIDPSEVKEKKVLSLGCFYLDWSVRSEVAKFNKESEDYVISVSSYSDSNDTSDWTAAMTKFNNEILAGNVPDILQISSQMSYDSLAAKGLFTDIYELIDNDPEFTKESFMPNVLTALEKDGKLYSICTSFEVSSYIAKKSIVGDKSSMTMDEAKAFVEKLEPGASLMSSGATMTASEFLSSAIEYNNLIDYKNASCSFDSDEFKSMLEAAKEYPAEIDYEKFYNENPNYWDDQEMACAENRALLQSAYFYDFNNSYNRIKEGYFKGEDITFVNFPGAPDDGSGAGILQLDTQFAVSSKSVFKEGAWEFIKTLVKGTVTEGSIPNWSDAEPKEDISGEIVYTNNGMGFPILMDNLNKLAVQATKPSKYIDSDGTVKEQENTWYINGKELNLPPMTAEQTDFLINYLKSVTKVSKYDENVNKIINEESALFFSGSKSADETAATIQSRVNIYLNEQYR